MSGRTYPPVDHLLRHLRMSFELRSADELVGSMPVSDDLRDPGGSPRMGAIAAFVDVAAGAFAHEQVRPDWLATTDMRVMLRRSSDADSVDVRTVAVRTGRRSVMTETQVSDGRGEFARGWVTYTRLPRRDDSPTLAGGSGVGRTFRGPGVARPGSPTCRRTTSARHARGRSESTARSWGATTHRSASRPACSTQETMTSCSTSARRSPGLSGTPDLVTVRGAGRSPVTVRRQRG